MKEIKDNMFLDWKNQYYENYYTHLPKAIYRINVTLIKSPVSFFTIFHHHLLKPFHAFLIVLRVDF